MPEQYEILVKPTLYAGFYIAEAYLSGRLVATSRHRYTSPHAARKDVSDQLREIELAQQPAEIPSAAAGGMR